MSENRQFVAKHINVVADDLVGNQGIGRYILLPGSAARAQELATRFNQVRVKKHPRGHDLYMGTLTTGTLTVDVATIATGMGCPSFEIILHELYQLGAKRFLRVGTAGSLQKMLKLGDIINVQAAVRDEDTTSHYADPAMPAVASYEWLSTIMTAAKQSQCEKKVHIGTVHCKSSFYAREFGAGPRKVANHAYLEELTNCGVLATEMETAALFIQSQIYNHELMLKGVGPQYQVYSGALLAIVSVPPDRFVEQKEERSVIECLCELAVLSVKLFAAHELNISATE